MQPEVDTRHEYMMNPVSPRVLVVVSRCSTHQEMRSLPEAAEAVLGNTRLRATDALNR